MEELLAINAWRRGRWCTGLLNECGVQWTFWRKKDGHHFIGRTVRWHSGNFSEFQETFSLSSLMKSQRVQQLQAVISQQIPACSLWYTKNTNAANKRQLLPPVVTRLLCGYSEIKIWLQQDLQFVPAEHSWALLTFKNQFPSELLLWLLHATSWLCKCHCMVVKNHSFTVSITLSCSISVQFHNFHFVLLGVLISIWTLWFCNVACCFTLNHTKWQMLSLL